MRSLQEYGIDLLAGENGARLCVTTSFDLHKFAVKADSLS